MTIPVLVGPDGRALDVARPRAGATAFQAASRTHPDMAMWSPYPVSLQGALSREQPLISARIHDIARNDGWASAAMDRQVDAVIGSGWRLSSKPNARSLGIDQAIADDLALAIEAEWSDYASDPAFWCNAKRTGPAASVLALAFRHRVMDGEAVAILKWLPRGGDYATAVDVIHPDRLSTPTGAHDGDGMCMGVELDGEGAASAYHIRRRHPADDGWFGQLDHWTRVPRETEWGRPIVIHAFEAKEAGQVRGLAPLTPILKKLKQITRYDEAELQAATLNAILAAFVESAGGTSAETMVGEVVEDHLDKRFSHYQSAPVRLPGVQVAYGYPGDKLTLTKPGHPNAAFEVFVRAGLRNVASAAGITYEQLTMDWSQVNYSSARAALLEVWRGLTARKDGFAASFMGLWYVAWLEEAVETGRVVLPKRAPPFRAKRAAYARAEWIGPGRGWVDPQKEAEAAATRLDVGLSTLERECAEQGLDWQDVLRQRAKEQREMQALGLDPNQPVRVVAPRQASGPKD